MCGELNVAKIEREVREIYTYGLSGSLSDEVQDSQVQETPSILGHRLMPSNQM